MNRIITLILALAVVIMAVVISVVEKSNSRGGGSSARGYRLVDVEPESVSAVTMRGGDLRVVMQRANESWFFTEPVEERISSVAMASLLDQLGQMLVLDRLDPEELVGEMAIDKLGLSHEEALELEFALPDGETATIALGNTTPAGGSVYARRLDGKKSGQVLIVDGDPYETLNAPYDRLRETRLVSLPVDRVTQIAMKTASTEMVLGRSQTRSDWLIQAPIAATADQKSIEELISSLLNLQILDAEDETDGSAAFQLPNEIPEGSALFQFAVAGLKKPIVLYLETIEKDDFGPPKLRARISDRLGSYWLHSDIIVELPDSPSQLRDRKLFSIPEQVLEQVVIFDIEGGRPSRSFVSLEANRNAQGLANWTVTQLDLKSVPANYVRLQALTERVAKPVVLKFIENGNLSDYGIFPDGYGVSFMFAIPGAEQPDGTIGPTQRGDRALRLGWAEKDGVRRLYGNIKGQDTILELDPTLENLLPKHPLKWRSLNIVSVNQVHAKSLEQSVKSREPIKLVYDKDRAIWSRQRQAGIEYSDNVDPIAVEQLASRLCSLRADGWLLQSGKAYAALAEPDATFTLVSRELDRATNQPIEVTRELKFARASETGNRFVFGQLDDNPDVFYIPDEQFRELIRPVTSSMAR